MKNIHILPTDKPTTLFKDDFGNFIYSINIDQEQNHFEPQHIYITSDEKIKNDDWVYCPVLKKPVFICLDSILMFKNLGYDSNGNSKYKKEWLKKIILTTDQDLIKDGVQAIDDEFLEWFVKNPSCEEVEVESNKCLVKRGSCGCFEMDMDCQCLGYKIIIPKEELEQETVEEREPYWELVDKKAEKNNTIDLDAYANGIRDGAKWQAERMYSEEEVLELILKSKIETSNLYYEDMKEWFEQIKKK